MTKPDPAHHPRVHKWYRRIALGVGFGGPGIILLILTLTLLSRVLGSSKSQTGQPPAAISSSSLNQAPDAKPSLNLTDDSLSTSSAASVSFASNQQ